MKLNHFLASILHFLTLNSEARFPSSTFPEFHLKHLYPSLFAQHALKQSKVEGNSLKRQRRLTANITVTRKQFIQIQFRPDLKRLQQTCETGLLWELIFSFHAVSGPARAYLYSGLALGIPAKNRTHFLSWREIYVAPL